MVGKDPLQVVEVVVTVAAAFRGELSLGLNWADSV
jgi:hypothetical protein